MAGLYIHELIMRADARRILVVAPGSLVEQWRDELFEKFGLQFNVFSSALEAATPTGNPFEDLDLLIVRLDQMARNEELQEKLLATSWDLVIFESVTSCVKGKWARPMPSKVRRKDLPERFCERVKEALDILGASTAILTRSSAAIASLLSIPDYNLYRYRIHDDACFVHLPELVQMAIEAAVGNITEFIRAVAEGIRLRDVDVRLAGECVTLSRVLSYQEHRLLLHALGFSGAFP